MTDPPTLEDQVRHRIADSGVTQAEIARKTGMKQPSISRFMRATRATGTDATPATVTAATLDKIINALGGAGLKWFRDQADTHTGVAAGQYEVEIRHTQGPPIPLAAGLCDSSDTALQDAQEAVNWYGKRNLVVWADIYHVQADGSRVLVKTIEPPPVVTG